MAAATTTAEIQRITTKSLKILISYYGNLCVYIDATWCHTPYLHERLNFLQLMRRKQCTILYHLSLNYCDEAEAYAVELGALALPCLAIFENGELVSIFSEKERSMESFVQELDYFSSPRSNLPCFFQQYNGPALRVFISGDRSSVGKTTTCQYLLAAFLNLGIRGHDLAYIKPVTQCEAEQSVVRFCDEQGIACCGIGPVVFYKGFTRAYLEGTTDTSIELLRQVQQSVENISDGKKIVLIDGVGYPSVGSICGVSNGDTAAALDAPVLLVSKSGVGDAVDSFNLNSCYFQSKGVTVLGAIFNKIPLEGYYNVEACRSALTSYFTQFAPQYHTYGFVPLFDNSAISVDQSHSVALNSEIVSEEIFRIFLSHVNVQLLLEDILLYPIKSDALRLSNWTYPVRRSLHLDDLAHSAPRESTKRLFQDITTPPLNLSFMTSGNTNTLESGVPRIKKSRKDIEVEALCSGAKAG